MMEVIESTELGAAALQPQRPWVVMSALGMVGGCRRHPSAARDIRRQHTIFLCVRAIFTSLCFGLSLLRNGQAHYQQPLSFSPLL
jgi:hypothetical protein